MGDAMPMPLKDISGQRFNRLVVVERVTRPGERESHWLCVCDCGNDVVVRGGRLRNGRQVSCGCFAAEDASRRNRTHGMTETPTWNAWTGMRQRCHNENDKNYKNYGKRGIFVCARWLESFENFLVDMGECPGPGFSLDRIDVDGPYSPENCRWATAIEQMRNKQRNHIVTYRGQQMTLMEACERAAAGVDWHKARNRLRIGWSVERAVEFAGDGRSISA